MRVLNGANRDVFFCPSCLTCCRGVWVSLGAALAVTLLSSGAASASVGGGAFALSANVNALVAPVSVGEVPSVTLPREGGGPFTASVLSANVLGLAKVDLAKVSTEGNAGVGSARGSSTLVNADVAGLVSVSAARSRCSASADSTDASASVVDLIVAGIPISTVDLGPNTAIALPVGRVVINEQIKDGASQITVNAVHVTLNALLVSGDVVLAQSRCSVNSAMRVRGKKTRRVARLRTAT